MKTNLINFVAHLDATLSLEKEVRKFNELSAFVSRANNTEMVDEIRVKLSALNADVIERINTIIPDGNEKKE